MSTTGPRSGFACLVGRPNVGKSTLTNALVGAKVAITSTRPQTTRHTVRGVANRPGGQLILVDTPGLHRPRTLLGQRLGDLVRATLAEVDVAVVCLPADEDIGPGDRYLVRTLARTRDKPVVAAVTKTDRVDRARLAAALTAVDRLGEQEQVDFAHIVPVCAVSGEQVELLADLLVELLPEGPPLFPEGQLTDEPDQVMVAELIREAALQLLRDELPHSLAVVVEEMVPRPDRPADRPLLDVRADLYVERASQKPIILGTRGERLKQIGSQARAHIEALLGTPVFLDLHVRVAKDWQQDPHALRRLGW